MTKTKKFPWSAAIFMTVVFFSLTVFFVTGCSAPKDDPHHSAGVTTGYNFYNESGDVNDSGAEVGWNVLSKEADPLPEAAGQVNWSKQDGTFVFDSGSLWKYINGAAEKYLQAGFEKLYLAYYLYGDDLEITAELFRMRSPESARRIFEFDLPDDSFRVSIGDDSQLRKFSLTFINGRNYVRLRVTREAAENSIALLEIGRWVEKNLDEEK